MIIVFFFLPSKKKRVIKQTIDEFGELLSREKRTFHCYVRNRKYEKKYIYSNIKYSAFIWLLGVIVSENCLSREI